MAVLLFLSTLPIGEHPLPDTVNAETKKPVVDEEAAAEERDASSD